MKVEVAPAEGIEILFRAPTTTLAERCSPLLLLLFILAIRRPTRRGTRFLVALDAQRQELTDLTLVLFVFRILLARYIFREDSRAEKD